MSGNADTMLEERRVMERGERGQNTHPSKDLLNLLSESVVH